MVQFPWIIVIDMPPIRGKGALHIIWGAEDMTLVQEAVDIMERMPRRKQQLVLELLHVMNNDLESNTNDYIAPDKRTGRSDFNLPADFDEHFDDLNDEITAMFMGAGV